MNVWNLIGLVAWLALIAYLIFIVWHIRNRHLKMVVMFRKQHDSRTWLLDLLEVAVLIAAFLGLAWVAWLRPVDYADRDNISVKYTYENLMLRTDTDRSYFVSVTSGNGTQPTRYYTYWTEGTKYQISSRNADVADAADPLTVRASAYPWQDKKLQALDKQAEKAYVATYIGTYKPTFLNGLGMRVGRTAQRFALIRIPNETFQKIVPK